MKSSGPEVSTEPVTLACAAGAADVLADDTQSNQPDATQQGHRSLPSVTSQHSVAAGQWVRGSTVQQAFSRVDNRAVVRAILWLRLNVSSEALPLVVNRKRAA